MTPAQMRDLTWLIQAPSLLSASKFQTQELLPTLPTAFRSWESPQTFKLGRYFESLVAQYIQQGLRADRFYSSVVLNRGSATLGELDLVFTTPDQPNVTQHWEIAVKFYLCQISGGSTELADFVGPQGRDRLDLKITKLVHHQLPLAQTPEAGQWFHSHSLPETVASSLLVKGTLFYPYAGDWQTPQHPEDISPSHSRGWWAETFPSERVEKDSLWVVLPKLQWLSPVAPDAELVPLTPQGARAHCETHFQTQTHALLFAQVTREHGEWKELCRGMIAQPTRAVTSI